MQVSLIFASPSAGAGDKNTLQDELLPNVAAQNAILTKPCSPHGHPQHFTGRLSKSGRMPAIAHSICPDDAAGTRCPAVRFSFTKASSQSWSVLVRFKGVYLSLKTNSKLLKHRQAN